AEAVVGQAHTLEHAAALELDAAQLGHAVAAGALVQHAVVVEQALGVGARVVWEAGEDLVAGGGLAAAARGGERREREGCERCACARTAAPGAPGRGVSVGASRRSHGRCAPAGRRRAACRGGAATFGAADQNRLRSRRSRTNGRYSTLLIL